MHYLVDGYNLLFCSLKKKGPLQQTRQRMIQELNEVISQLCLDVVLIFDGSQENLPYLSRGHFDTLEIVYTSKEQTADEYITEEVIYSKAPSEITVVSNDRELTNRCRHNGAKTQTIEQFISYLQKKRRKHRKAQARPSFKESDPELARLLAIFEKRLSEELDL